MISIVDASEKDIPLIQELAEKTWWPTYDPILPEGQVDYMLKTIYSAETMLRVMNEGSQRFVLLYEGEEPVAFASFGVWEENANTWKIFKLYVLPGRHGKGLGKKLLDHITERAKAKNIENLVLNVNRQNPAFHFYCKTGFSVLREEDIPIGPFWMNDYVMQLPLQ